MESLHTSSSWPQSDWTQRLPREAFSEIILLLRDALPRPLDETPAEAVVRDRAAMASVAALLPETATEGRLAARFIAADAWAMDCLRLARETQREPRIAERCRAQAMGMMREAKSALKSLEKAQAGRRALAKDEAASERAAWVEHAAVTMMADALEGDVVGEDAVVTACVQKVGPVSKSDPTFAKARAETMPRPLRPDVRRAATAPCTGLAERG